MSPEWVRENLTHSFAAMYLTLLSIIQGVALAMWATESIPTTSAAWGKLLSIHGATQMAVRLATLLAIVVLWHAYFWLAMLVRWIPTIWDSLLTFTIGGVEFAAILNMGQPAWFVAFGCLGVLGGLAYRFNVREVTEQGFADDAGSKELYRHIKGYKEGRSVRLLWISFVFLAAIVVVALGAGTRYLDWTLPIPLAAEVWLIGRHVKDREKTLKALRR